MLSFTVSENKLFLFVMLIAGIKEAIVTLVIISLSGIKKLSRSEQMGQASTLERRAE